MRTSSFEPGSKRKRRRALMWLGVLSLLVSLINPLIALQAQAEEDSQEQTEQDCGEGQYYDEGLGYCVDIPECPEGEIFDPAQGGCVQDPNYQPEQEPGIGVQVEKWDCDTPDAYNWGWEQLQDDCAAYQGQVTFYHGGDGLQESSQQGSYVEWIGDPAGNHYVYEQVPDGYGAPRVFCVVYVAGMEQPTSGGAIEYDVQNGNAVGWQLDPGEYVYCWWFNIAAEGEYGQVHITKYDCADYQGVPNGQGWQEWQQECDPWSGPAVEYQLYLGQQEVGRQDTDSGGETHFDEVPAGNITVAEVLPDGYAYAEVWCSYYPAENSSNGSYEPVNVQQGFFHEWNLEPGYYLDCLWFNFYEPVEGGYIDFYKYVCPYDLPTDGGYEYYLEECSPYEGWNFDVQWDGGGGSSKSTDSSGYASWEGVPQGTWTASEDVEDGWGEPLVWCRYVEWPDEAGYDSDWFPYDPSNGQIEYEYEYDGIHIECYWFNFEPDGGAARTDGNWIDFYKYVCPYDTPVDQDYDYYLEECQAREGWDFEVDWDGGGSTGTTDSEGYYGWSGVPGIEWTATETYDEGWGEPLLWCRYVDWPDEAGYNNDWVQYSAEGGVFPYGFDADYSGVRFECYWFNFEPEDDYNWVDFYKYVCPYELPRDGGYDYYFEECQAWSGWDFELEWDGGGSTGTTGTDGHYGWSGVQGTWTGSETLDEGWGEPLVWCRYVNWPDDAGYDNEWFSMDLALNGVAEIEGQFEYDNVRIECYWFNFQDEGHYVDFYKYVCPYDLPTDGDYEYYFEECAPYEGWDFNLQWDGGGTHPGTTDSEGYYGWSGVPRGPWAGQETLEEGWGQPLVWCRYVDWPDEAGYDSDWFPMDVAVNGVAEFGSSFEYDAGVRIECYWFNFEPADEYNWIDFYKYACAYDAATDEDYDYYVENCEPVEDWQFDVSWENGGSTGSTDESGYYGWSGVPTGSWQAQEEWQEGYGQPILYCRYVDWPDEAGYDGEWVRYDAPDGYFEHEFEYDNVRIECYWFNFYPEGGSVIQFYKLWCSDEATYSSTFDELRGYCEFDENRSAEITFGYGSTSATRTLSGEDSAQWAGVPTGEWWVEETPQEGWGQPVIWCQYVEWPEGSGLDQDPYMPNGEGWRWTWEHEYDGLVIACAIFNIPYEQNYIEVTKWWCSDAVTNPYEQSVDNLYEDCERYTEGVEFTLEYEGDSETITTDGEGNAEWSGLPGGNWTMNERREDGWADPVVWCRWVEWPESAQLSDEATRYDAPNAIFTGSFDWGGMRIHCDVFNIPDYEYGWITVYKWYCATGIAPDSSADYLRDECDPVSTGVDFSLDYGQTSIPMTTDSEGKAEWTEVPTGSWTLRETSASGYGAPVIYCQWVGWPAAAEGEYNQDLYQPEQEGAAITGTHEYPGLRLVCYWFNFEYEGGDNWVIFYKYYCQPGADYGDSFSDWRENCQEPVDGQRFTLENEQGTYPGTTEGGTVEWRDLEDGALSVQEDLPTGYEEPVVWCYRVAYDPASNEIEAVDLGQFELSSAPQGRWEGSLDDGPWRIICYWFNIPGDDNTVTIFKYYCEYRPAGFNTLWQWQEACNKKHNDVTFTLGYGATSESKSTADGKVEWTGVPEGEFTLTEEPKAGYSESVWWCGWRAWVDGEPRNQPPQWVEAPGGSYEASLRWPGETYYCYVFNIPDEKSKITIVKYNCPEAWSNGDSLDNYLHECKEKGNGIDFTLDNSKGSSTKTTMNGSASWYDVPQGEFTITEDVPEGYGEPVWFCAVTGYTGGAIADGFPTRVEAPGGVFTGSIDFAVTYYYCWVFNFPDYDREVTVYKWYCPADMVPTSDEYEDWREACTTAMSGISFHLDWGSGAAWRSTNVGGKASWYGVEPGEVTLTEQHLPGYESVVFYCSLEATYEDGAAYAEGYSSYPVSDRSITKDLGDYAGFKWVCHVFNIPKGPGEITIYKWYCPAGYDVTRYGADPTEDCTTEAPDGVPFVLDRPVGANLTQETGDSLDGGIYWNDLGAGSYVVSEQVPSDIDYTFIWDCYGGDIPAVHPNPLTWGSVLHVDVAGGDQIVCHWYNVPKPVDGWITLYKYQCWTTTYKSDVDCEIYEFGATFEVFSAEGETSQGTGTTNAGGNYTWSDLDEGAYTLDEISHTPCKITSTKVDESGNIWVDAGQGTIVKVYNCSQDSTTPTPGGKVPTKYPNTGVDPSGDVPVSLAQDDEDATEEADDQQTINPDDEGTPDPQQQAAEFYTVSCLNAEDTGSLSPGATTTEPEEEEGGGLPPFLQEGSDEAAATEEPDAESTQAPDGEAVECERGAVPQSIVIDAANVNYDIEVLEILDGVMQAPTGPEMVSWYKETARLGEPENIVIAGHVNWWNVPEGPFAHLADLAEGDRIEVTGEDGNTYVFEVQWVSQESNLEPPDPSVVGPTGEASLTLITCGGEWDASISEYNERTVVRAIQVDVIPGDQPADTGEEEEEQGGWIAPVALVRNQTWALAA